MNYKKPVIILVILFSLIYICYKYYLFKNYINIYNNEIVAFADYVESYSISRLENVSNDRESFEKMFEKQKEVENFRRLMEYGIGYKYDDFTGLLSVYSFGIDKTDDFLEKPSYSRQKDISTPLFAYDVIDDWNFCDIFDTIGRDVILFSTYIHEDFLCVNFGKDFISSGLPLYSFYDKKNNKISNDLEKKIRNKISKYVFDKQKNIRLGDNLKRSFLRYKNGEFQSIICWNDVDIDLSVFQEGLKEILMDNDIDYAVIPILHN